jgi:uncharacterized membrane protein
MIRNPVVWSWDRLKGSAGSIGSAPAGEYWQATARPRSIAVARIGLDDLRLALRRGLDDFAANRSDVVFLCLFYPLVGLLLGRLASGDQMLPLLFPLASGFALIGPLAALGLYELSRRREQGQEVHWTDPFRVLRSPSIGAIALLGFGLVCIFLLWLVAASAIYQVTLGPAAPASVASFAHDVFATGPGWAMIVIGVAVGFLFAVVVLAVSVVSFPLLLDADVGVERAVRTSIRAVRANPRVLAIWGLIVAAGLVVGSVPLFLGLPLVLPVLGHATWHLYRRLVPH